VIQQNKSTQAKKYYDEDGKLIIKPYFIKDLANIYDVSPRTIKRWIVKLEIGIDKNCSRYFTVQEVLLIIEKLGVPRTSN